MKFFQLLSFAYDRVFFSKVEKKSLTLESSFDTAIPQWVREPLIGKRSRRLISTGSRAAIRFGISGSGLLFEEVSAVWEGGDG